MRIETARGQCEIRHSLECWQEVSRRIQEAKEIQVYLDFDGTLVHYRANPEDVNLRKQAKVALRRLAKHRNVRVAIVSGRRRGVLVQHVKVRGMRFMGLYGWEDERGRRMARRTLQAIRRSRRALASLPAELPGISIEDKGISVAVHFRGASAEMRRRAETMVRRVVGKSQSDVHVIRANDVWDVVPRQVRGKGYAVRRALRGAGPGVLPIYVGDDVTDESAFVALRRGITVLTGPCRKTAAQFGLRNPEEVCAFLKKLETEINLKEKSH